MATPSCTAFFFWFGGFGPLLVSPVRLSLGEGPQNRSLNKCKVSHHQPHLKFMCRQASDIRDCNNCYSARVSYMYIIRPTYTIQQTYQTLLEHLVAKMKSINYGGLRWEGYRWLGTYWTLKCSSQDKPAALTSYEHLGVRYARRKA